MVVVLGKLDFLLEKKLERESGFKEFFLLGICGSIMYCFLGQATSLSVLQLQYL